MIMENIFTERLNLLRGTEGKNEFARRCDIKPSTMLGYLNGTSEPGLQNLQKIADAFGTSIGWLAGEGDDNEEKRYKGLSIERHIEVGEMLKQITHKLDILCTDFEHAFPQKGTMARATIHLKTAREHILEARNFAEENLYTDYEKDDVNFDIYYGDTMERKLKKQKGTNHPDEAVDSKSVNGN